MWGIGLQHCRGPAVLAGELLDWVRAVLPVIGGLEEEQVLVSAWPTGLRSAHT